LRKLRPKCGGSQNAVADCREIARAATLDHESRKRARKIRRSS
jgi:hypothetical protein